MTIRCESEQSGRFRQVIHVGDHVLNADVGASLGGESSAPDPHDLFDASVAACKALTITWYAKKNNMALDRVAVSIDRDDSRERQGTYVLKVKLELFGSLSDAEKTKLVDIAGRCPVHKLMTTTTVEIETTFVG